jgi:hypothetical protein
MVKLTKRMVLLGFGLLSSRALSKALYLGEDTAKSGFSLMKLYFLKIAVPKHVRVFWNGLNYSVSTLSGETASSAP